MSFKDSVAGTLTVAGLLCVVCSVLVSGSAVILRPKQEFNKRLDIKKNLLIAAGVVEDSNITAQKIEQAYKNVKAQVIDFETGEVTDMDPETFDQNKAAKTPGQNISIPNDKDLGRIRFRSKYGKVFQILENGQVVKLVLPIKGKGLWSTLYGFITLDTDTKTVLGIGYYQHGETAGLGGEVDNPKWKQGWKNKVALNDSYEPIIDVVKGSVNLSDPNASHQIDGLSGATLTSNGVEGMVNYWLGEHGYGAYLEKFRSEAM